MALLPATLGIAIKKIIGSIYRDFPGGSDGKESACSAGDLGLIPELGRSPREKTRKLGYPTDRTNIHIPRAA